MIRDVVIIGSGNVAWHLGKVLFESGFNILEIFGRNKDTTQELAIRFSANSVSELTKMTTSADLYLIAVNDDSISTICKSMPQVNGIVVHTSGSIGLEPLKRFKNYGVFYPFQTLTKEKVINFKSVQLLIEGSSEEVLSQLKKVASDISNSVMVTTYDQRKQLHIAAIFASNFVNHFYSIAHSFLKEKNLPFSLLIPLIEETTDKIKHLEPHLAQTGPAKRGDEIVIQKHLNTLENNPDYQLIYDLLTKSIQKGIY